MSKQRDTRTDFADRIEGGQALAGLFADLRDAPDAIVLGLPRGGVPVAAEVARTIGAPLDAFVVRKIGAPRQPELALGAIASGDALVLNQPLIAELGVSEEALQGVIDRERDELSRREEAYRGGKPSLNLRGKTVLLVDDGLATGSTMQVAVQAVRAHQPGAVMIGVPIASQSAIDMLRPMVDRLECPLVPPMFMALGQWYRDFRPTSDRQVLEALQELG